MYPSPDPSEVLTNNTSTFITFLQGSSTYSGNFANPNNEDTFYVNYGYASKVLKEVFKNYKNFIPKARKQARISREEFNLSKMNEGMGTIIDKYVQIKEQVSISLPKLQKVGKKIELPTLQPVR